MLRPGTSLAVYMGVRQAPLMVQALHKAQVPMSLEVEIISKASTCDEKILRCNLAALPATLKQEDVENPAIIFIRWPKDTGAQIVSITAAKVLGRQKTLALTQREEAAG